MVIESIIGMQQLQTAYSYFNSGKRKERFDVILEPLQAITQLAYLKACPVGTKLTIENNLLFIQIPHWHQGLTRSWNKDKREDILLLFNAVQRYNKIYVNECSKSTNPTYKKLIELLTRMAIEGIDNLISTYSRIENTSIVQTLVMYRTILCYPDRFTGIEDMNDRTEKIDKKMEDVFAQIKSNWNDNELAILYNTLYLIDTDKGNAETYINGMNDILAPLYGRIRKWISDNIVY